MSKPPALNKDQISKIVKSMESGTSLESIANNYRMSLPTLRNNLRRNGHGELAIARNPHCRRMTEEDVETARKMMVAGASQNAAARAIGFTAQALAEKLRGRVRGPRNQPKKPKDRPQENFKDEALKNRIDFNNRYLSTLQLRVSSPA